jgi:pimeloyl-ACP methyl ester carboxylesterase
MNNGYKITRINHEDPHSKAALAAERRLFAHFGLEYKVHFVEMKEPNLRIRILEVGEGEPLMMVPGGSGEAWFFAPLMAELKGRRMIALSRPGGGLSDGIDHRNINVRKLAVNTLRSVADAFGLERVPIICNSMGGLWSIWYALDHPERVSRMAHLGCPALILDTSAPFFMRLIGVPGINNLIAPMMQPNSVDGALDSLTTQGIEREEIDKMPRVLAEASYHFFQLPTYLDTWKTLIAEITTIRGGKAKYQLAAEELKQIRQPVQFLWGHKDPFGDLDVARQVTRLIPQAKLHEMQTGHLPFLDKAAESGRIISEFLAEETADVEQPLVA